MDGHRFDVLTQRLATLLDRRHLVAGLSLLSLGAATEAAKKRKKRKKKKRKPSCSVNHDDAATTTTLVAKHKALSLTTFEQVPLNPTKALTTTTTVRQKRSLLLQTTVTFGHDAPMRIQTSYGKAFKGIKESDFTSDGTTVWGTIDGRAIVPFPASATPDALQFEDGRPAPAMAASKQVAQQLEKLFAVAEAKAATCDQAGAPARTSGVSAQSAAFSVKCLACKATCVGGSIACASKVKGVCAPAAAVPFVGAGLFALCVGAGIGTCTTAALVCVDLCRDANFCCPVACGNQPDATCCEERETCLVRGDVGTFRCCRAGEAPCHGRNCCASANRCLPDGSCCDPPNIPCGQNCCGPFSRCCNGRCCSGVCDGRGDCCEPPGFLCNNTCCSTDCCNNSVCCPPGQDCHPQTNQCAVLCPPTHRYCRESGQCCAAGTTCCRSPGGTWGCFASGCVN